MFSNPLPPRPPAKAPPLSGTPTAKPPDLPVTYPRVPPLAERSYYLTRLYEGERPCLPEDQDALDPTMFRPVARFAKEETGSRLDMAHMSKEGEPRTSNGLGIFRDLRTGVRYYLKKAKDERRATSEAMFADLARLFGLNVPVVQVLKHGTDHLIASSLIDGLVVAHEMFPNCAIDPRQLARIARECPQVGEALVIGALTKNWDICGSGCDNFGFVSTDGGLQPYFFDHGGAGEHRATGGCKPFGPATEDFFTMTEPTLQSDQYGGGPNGLILGMTPQSVHRKVMRGIYAVPDAAIRAVIDSHVPDTVQARRVFGILIARRDAIHRQIESGKPNRLQEKFADDLTISIDNLFGWDDDDAELRKAITDWFHAKYPDYLRDNLNCMADSVTRVAMAEDMHDKMKAEFDTLIRARLAGGERAVPPWRKRKAAAAEGPR